VSNTAANGKRRRLREDAAQRGPLIDRMALYEQQNGMCWLCKTHTPIESFTLDHVIPLAKGGLHAASNLRVAHPRCNRSKGDRAPGEKSKSKRGWPRGKRRLASRPFASPRPRRVRKKLGRGKL
jgi:5-methylcytosine-specific restriction endonuclease McrA